MEIISVEEAVKKAFWRIKVPAQTVLVTPLLSYAILAKLNVLPSMGYEGFLWAAPTFIFSIIGSWLVWSIQVPRWRLWAYQRVKDINDLKEYAIYKEILRPEGSFFQKTELASKKLWKEIKQIEKSKNKKT